MALLWACSILALLCLLLALPLFFAGLPSPLMCPRPHQARWLISYHKALIHTVRLSVFLSAPAQNPSLQTRFLRACEFCQCFCAPVISFSVDTTQKFSSVRGVGNPFPPGEWLCYASCGKAYASLLGRPSHNTPACSSARGLSAPPFI